jgi:phage shock protein PspC (stress-responsive transcriptional regulator)
MTETTAAPRPLYRDPDDKVLTGVCAAVGRFTDTDPVLWRVVVGVLTVFGGAGLLLYLLGWLLIPERGAEQSLAEGWLRRRSVRATPRTLALIAVGAVVALAVVDHGDGAVVLAVVAAIAYLVHRDQTLAGRPPDASAVGLAGDVAAPAAEAPWPAPRPRRRRSRLGPVTLSSAALVSGILVLLRVYGADGLTGARILAVALAVVGVGLVVGTWYGRARWLAFVAALLAVALAGAAAADGQLGNGVGERRWAVATTQPHQSFALGAGDATLDLSQLDAQGGHLAVDARVGVGHLLVLLPPGLPVRVHARAAYGEVVGAGLGDDANGDDVDRTVLYGTGDPRVELDVRVGTGQVEVRRG